MEVLLIALIVVLASALVGGIVAILLLQLRRNQEKQLQEHKGEFSGLLDERLRTSLESNLGDLRQQIGSILESQRKFDGLQDTVNSLNNVMTNKQARGQFGEIQLMDIVTDALPREFYEFQVTLTEPNDSKSHVVDCLLKLPEPTGAIPVDSKFPMESFVRLSDSDSKKDADDSRKELSNDIKRHIRSIQEKYIIEGITADCALLFLPSEAVFATVHSELPDVIAESQQKRVYVVGPSTLMATVTTLRAIYRDVEIRKQAKQIQTYLETMLKDLSRFNERMNKLENNLTTAQETFRTIRISSDKIVSGINKVNEIEIPDDSAPRIEDASEDNGTRV